MKLFTHRETLLEPLQAVSGVVERRQTLPVLSSVLIECKEEACFLTTSDLEVEVQSTIALVAEELGKTAASARKLLGIIRALPAKAKVALSQGQGHLEIQSGTSRFKLATFEAADFPKVGEIEARMDISIDNSILLQLIQKTQFAMAQQDVRFFLNGILMDFDGKKMVIVATDGHRLALSETGFTLGHDDGRQVIVPRKAVQEMMRLLEDGDGEAEVRIGENHIQVGIGRKRLTAKLIDASFPDYRRVIPRGGEHVIRVDRVRLQNALCRIAVVSPEKHRGIKAEFLKERLRVSTRNLQQETAEEEIETDYEGTELSIGFNLNYLMDVVSVIATEEIVFELRDPDSGCVILPGDGNEADKYVVMPMRL